MVKLNIKKIRFLMYKHRINQRELSEIVGISRERINAILNNKNTVRETTLTKIAKALKVDEKEIKKGE